MRRAAIRAAVGLVVAGALLAVHWSSAWAQPAATITLPPPGTTKQLYVGCNNIALTFPDGTASATVTQAVTPAGTLQAMWRHNAPLNKFEGFSPTAPQASDLLTVNFLDAVWLCLGAAAPAASTPPPVPTPGPTSTSTAIVTPTDALDSFAYVFETSMEAGGELIMSFTATGQFEAPDSMSCSLSGQVGGLQVSADQLVVTGEGAWIDSGGGFVPVSKDSPELAEDLGACAGSPTFWEGLDLPPDVPPGVPETVNGVPASRYSLAGVLEVPASFGVMPPEMEGMTINAFDVWVAEDGGWLVRLVADVSMNLEASPEDVGIQTGQPVRMVMQLDITDPNSPNIHIEPPAP
jgi:hypothetical protein